MRSGAKLEYGVKAVSVRATCSVWEPLITLAWFYPPNIGTGGRGRKRDFSFGVEGILNDESAPEPLVVALRDWISEFANDEFSSDVSGGNIDAYSFSYEHITEHGELISDRLRSDDSEFGQRDALLWTLNLFAKENIARGLC